MLVIKFKLWPFFPFLRPFFLLLWPFFPCPFFPTTVASGVCPKKEALQRRTMITIHSNHFYRMK